MKLTEYIEARVREGLTLTAAVESLMGVAFAGKSTVWRWYSAGQAPSYAERLMQVWAEATPEQRARWFK